MSEAQTPNVLERGAARDGQPQAIDRRVFFQLLPLEPVPGIASADAEANLRDALSSYPLGAVLYEDFQNPTGWGLLLWHEDPGTLQSRVRELFAALGADSVRPLREGAFLGRTYATGYEQDLEFWLLRRPVETVLREDAEWAIWYPLRRTGEFEQLAPADKGRILRQHGEIGRAYGEADFAHDVRLACHGLDSHDNEFLIGLIGKELHPLSHVVQAMRPTEQTSRYIQQMGPFFVGRAVFRKAEDA